MSAGRNDMTYNDHQLGLSNVVILAQKFNVCVRATGSLKCISRSLIMGASHTLAKNIETAFALTIHKSQGSEFQHVAVLDQAAQNLLSKELILYRHYPGQIGGEFTGRPAGAGTALTVKTSRNSRESKNEHLSL